MSQKTTSKGPDLRQMRFDFTSTAKWARSRQTSLNELLAIKGLYRGSDPRFVLAARNTDTLPMRRPDR